VANSHRISIPTLGKPSKSTSDFDRFSAKPVSHLRCIVVAHNNHGLVRAAMIAMRVILGSFGGKTKCRNVNATEYRSGDQRLTQFLRLIFRPGWSPLCCWGKIEHGSGHRFTEVNLERNLSFHNDDQRHRRQSKSSAAFTMRTSDGPRAYRCGCSRVSAWRSFGAVSRAFRLSPPLSPRFPGFPNSNLVLCLPANRFQSAIWKPFSVTVLGKSGKPPRMATS
jgi:hypothetical protein